MTTLPVLAVIRRRLAHPHVEAALVGLLVASVHLMASISAVLRVGAINDDGVYLTLGRALAEGHGYHSMHLVGAPVQVKYPPGFPVILSVLWRLGGSVEAVQHLVGLLHPLVIGVAAALLWWVGRACLVAPRALLALLVILPFLFTASIDYYTIVLSEPWMILGWAGVLSLWLGAAKLDPGRGRLARLAACGGLVAITILIRTHAIVLLPAIAVGLLASRHRRVERVVVAIMVVAPLGLWYWYHFLLTSHGPVSQLPDEGPYVAWMHGAGVQLVRALAVGAYENAAVYLARFSSYLSGISLVGHVQAVLLIGGAALGAAWSVRREPVLGLSALGGVFLILLWPFAQDRLLLPLLPFLGLAACVVLPRFYELASVRVRHGVSLIAAILMVSVLLRQPDVRQAGVVDFANNRDPEFVTPTWMLLLNSRYISLASRWVRDNTRATDRLMIDNHSGIYLYSGRTTVPANPAESRLRKSVFTIPGHYLATRILRDSLDYVIVGLRYPDIMRDLATVSTRCPGVLSWGGTSPNDSKYIYRVRRDEACLRSLAGAAE